MTMSMAIRPLVAVFGSINLDVSIRVRSLPRPGETVIAPTAVTGPGGKGANQAVAVARTGVAVALLSAVGGDDAASEVVDALAAAGVDTAGIAVDRSKPTGRAHITVDDTGENMIVIASGANTAMSARSAEAVATSIEAAAVLVVQGELPVDATRAAIRMAAGAGTRVVANLAPFIDLGDLLAVADPVVVNEVEASELIGSPIAGLESVRALASRYSAAAPSVVVTLGGAGAALCRDGVVTEFPAARPTRVVDTTGAGDAFVGVLAAALARGLELEHAVAAAVDAATRTVEAVGAAAAYPRFDLPAGRAEVTA